MGASVGAALDVAGGGGGLLSGLALLSSGCSRR